MSAAAAKTYAAAVYRSLLRGPAQSPLHAAVHESLVASWDRTEAQPRGARTVMALSAPYSLGKSTVATAFARQVYLDSLIAQRITPSSGDLPVCWVSDGHARDIEADYVPVLYLNMQSDTASRDLYVQVLAFLQHGTGGTRGVLASRATAALVTHGARLLVVDDAHMLRTHLIQGRATLDALKHLATELGTIGGSMLLVGAFSNESDVLRDPQLRARLVIHTLSPYQGGTDRERQCWQQYLKQWEAQIRPYLPDLEPGTLWRLAPGHLLTRTQGYAGDVTACIAHAVRSALAQRRTTFTLEDLLEGPVSQRALDEEAGIRAKAQPRTRRRATP